MHVSIANGADIVNAKWRLIENSPFEAGKSNFHKNIIVKEKKERLSDAQKKKKL